MSQPSKRLRDVSGKTGLPWWLRWCRICLQCGRTMFYPWDGDIPLAKEINGYLLHYSFLENSMNKGTWWATLHGIIKSQTWSGIISSKTHPMKFCTKLIDFSDKEKCSDSQGKRPRQLTTERLHLLLTWQQRHTKQVKEWSKYTQTQVFLTWTFSEFENVMV